MPKIRGSARLAHVLPGGTPNPTAAMLTRGLQRLANGEDADDRLDRPEMGHANYRGDVVEELLEEPIMGPTTTGEQLIAVSAVHDPIADRTRVAFVYATPADIEREIARTALGGA